MKCKHYYRTENIFYVAIAKLFGAGRFISNKCCRHRQTYGLACNGKNKECKNYEAI